MVVFVNDAALQFQSGNGFTCILRIYEDGMVYPPTPVQLM
jgi:hypothetical protein